MMIGGSRPECPPLLSPSLMPHDLGLSFLQGCQPKAMLHSHQAPTLAQCPAQSVLSHYYYYYYRIPRLMASREGGGPWGPGNQAHPLSHQVT